MSPNAEREAEERNVYWMKKVLIGVGLLFVLVGLIRQWPIVGKSYMEFIGGEGYLGLMLGLIMILLGFSIRLLMGCEKDD